jgi:hypothetical protein
VGDDGRCQFGEVAQIGPDVATGDERRRDG